MGSWRSPFSRFSRLAGPASALVSAPATTPTIAAEGGGRLALFSPTTGLRIVLPENVSQPSWSPNGRAVAFVRGGDIYTFTLPNTVRRLTNSSTPDNGPAWSPNGAEIAWSANNDIRAMNANGNSKRLVAGGASRELEPAWTPDGAQIVFATDRDGNWNIYSVNVSTDVQSPVVQTAGDQRDPAVSPNGAQLAYSSRSSGNTDIWVSTIAGASPTRLTTVKATDAQPTWSPSGGRIAFSSNRKNGARIWTMTPGGGDQKVVKASRKNDFHPSWSNARSTRLLPLPGETLPDLDQRSPAGLVVVKLHGHWHLGFDSAVDNVGTGPLWIRGTRPNVTVKQMRADQLVELKSGKVRRYRKIGSLHYEAHQPHYHWHFEPFERYELRRASDFAMLVRDRKSGFCLADHYGGAWGRVKGEGPPRFLGNCQAGNTRAKRVDQGSSIGYTDRYPALFHGQDVRLTGVPAGTYVLVHRANPARFSKELRYDNNAASVRIRLRWPNGKASKPTIRVLKVCQTSQFCG